MEWILTDSINQSDIWKLQNAAIELSFKFNKKAGSIRINIEEPRIYFLEKSGLFKQHVDIISQFNHHIATCSIKKQKGKIKTDLHTYHFSVSGTIVRLMNEEQSEVMGEFTILHNYTETELFALLFSYLLVYEKNYASQKTNNTTRNDFLMVV